MLNNVTDTSVSSYYLDFFNKGIAVMLDFSAISTWMTTISVNCNPSEKRSTLEGWGV